ncbi:MAG: hypothetical protein ACM3S2_14775, partial [Ignavibacteriales bacterium]
IQIHIYIWACPAFAGLICVPVRNLARPPRRTTGVRRAPVPNINDYLSILLIGSIVIVYRFC